MSVSPRREEILELVAVGYSRSEIAEELDMSSNAVKKTLRSACREHGVNMAGLRQLLAGRAEARGVESPA